MSTMPTSPLSPSATMSKLHASVLGPTGAITAAPKTALTPPTSEEWNKADISDLSDLELDDEDDDAPIEPDHYYEGGQIPVFKPTIDQFRSFKRFIAKIDKYGMKSGIVKVIPPKEWTTSLPALDERVKTIKVKNPITQEFSGMHGTYTQANVEKQRSYNLPQWKALTEESQHQPPARRGERRLNTDKHSRTSANRMRTQPSGDSTASKRKPGRSRKSTSSETSTPVLDVDKADYEADPGYDSVMPNSAPQEVKPNAAAVRSSKSSRSRTAGKTARAGGDGGSGGGGRQPKTVSERRKYNRRDMPEEVDEAAFEDFDYRITNHDDYTVERCTELETLYWKSLTFAPPMYGADMPGSLFDDSTRSWNVAKLENLLDVLGQKIPGVNTAYLYLGMWKASFAWHLEDVDLYSINYIHFGAPKQWYSISQEDARRFEAAMKTIWPNDAKNCGQFLRHKTYLISPALLQSQFNIKVNKLVHHEGEFVITYPYGYHSGYNLGYNCAESVNFATESWLEYGRIAKKCDCEADSVWVNVEDIERKLRGETTPEYYEESDEDDNLDRAGEEIQHLPSPPASVKSKMRQPRKRKHESTVVATEPEHKKIRIRIKPPSIEPCILCPNDAAYEDLLSTDNGKHAHRICASYIPETYLDDETGTDVACNVAAIDKARLDLKCSFCRSKKGACFQCSSKKCTRAYHATCAAAAGVQVEYGFTPYYGEDGTEYIGECYDFRCRIHRAKRAKHLTLEALENSSSIMDNARALKSKDVVQIQYMHAGGQGEIFAGLVLENRPYEQTAMVQILPNGDQVEVEWKWILALDPAASQLVKPSANAKPLPSHLSMSTVQTMQNQNLEFGPPLAGDAFNDVTAPQKWAEFNLGPQPKNSDQIMLDLKKENQIWHYLGKSSTEAKAQFTENLNNPRFNPAGNFLDTLKPVSTIPSTAQNKSVTATYPPGVNYHALNGAMVSSRLQTQHVHREHSNPEQSHMRREWTQPLQHQSSESSRSWTAPNDGISSTFDNNMDRTIQQPRLNAVHDSLTTPRINGFPIDPLAGRPVSRYTCFSHEDERPVFPHTSSYADSTPSSNTTLPKMLTATKPVYPSGFPLLDRPAHQEDLHRLTRYTYLRNAFCRRPQFYKTPYHPQHGYTHEVSEMHFSTNIVKEEPRQWLTDSLQQVAPPGNIVPQSSTTYYVPEAALFSFNKSFHHDMTTSHCAGSTLQLQDYRSGGR